jgi:hypothetical protein
VESATAYVDWGQASGIREGDVFLLYRVTGLLKHPVTGEILGHAQQMIGNARVEHVEEKFSVAHLMEGQKVVQAGDRTRLQTLPVMSDATPTIASATVSALGLKDLWHSEPLPEEAVGLVVADVDGDGSKEIVVATKDQIKVYRVQNNQLLLITTYQDRNYRHWLSIDAADLAQEGHENLFASALYDSIHRPRTLVLQFENGSLKPLDDIDGFVRRVDRSDGSRPLLIQTLLPAQAIRFEPPTALLKNGKSYKTGEGIKIAPLRDDQLFGFTWGDWDGDHSEDLAFLEGGDQLRIFFHSLKWNATDNYGGTLNDFSIHDQHGSVVPRLLSYQPAKGPVQLIVSRNVPEIGIHVPSRRLYRRSEIAGLAWTGHDMAVAWHQEIVGYLADVAIGDALGTGHAQLWTSVLSSDGKTMLTAYRLP